MHADKDIEVWIESGGVRFEEYDVKVADSGGTESVGGQTTTCWIASEVGKVSILPLKRQNLVLANYLERASL